ncbi:DUF2490 domain-containing protein [Pedobacter sp. SYSU D00535]|uniref:DUF2490 domain-containing protein n=1 Tax=Pedobacter sp. SYSU D00535 TaxID=2810308 RepID=UPI001A96095C|nr:DUF2490 domain-containing protein [Pedobacter sp. SYSU D00535]
MLLFRFMPRMVLAGLVVFLCLPGSAQTVQRGTEFWPQYYVNFALDSNWSVASDYSHRYAEFNQRNQWIGRVGLQYQISPTFSASVGYAYSEYFSGSSVRRENRPWQQLQLVNKFSGFLLQHRLRLEERFNKDNRGERFNYRLRFQLQLHVPVLPQQKLTAFISEEPMVNFGSEVTGKKFDQNRIQAGLQIKLVSRIYFTPAYQHTFQLQANKTDFKSLHILRTGFTYKK